MQNLENNDFIHSETLSAFLSREKLQKNRWQIQAKS